MFLDKGPGGRRVSPPSDSCSGCYTSHADDQDGEAALPKETPDCQTFSWSHLGYCAGILL